MGIAPTGKRVTWSGINIFRVVDGRIAEDTPHWDFSVILRQLQD
jgi:predicted ester cyclase